MAVILRTHGGLGNQLFQVLYGRLVAEARGVPLRELHDTRYRHGFPRSTSLTAPATRAGWAQRGVSALRLPKLLQRAMGRTERPLALLGDAYLDGYFQDAWQYRPFETAALKRHLRAIAVELSINVARVDRCLVHLRLGDFFKTRAEAVAHVVQRLQSVPRDAALMTNDEALLAEPQIAELLRTRGCELLSTSGFSAERVLQLMARHQRFDSNDSTMVFWASLLGGGEAALQHPPLRETHTLLCTALWRSP
jgi:hypothetical protein